MIWVILGLIPDADVENYPVSKIEEPGLHRLEADSFWCFSKLLDGIQDNYTFAQPGIQKRVNLLKELITRIDSKLRINVLKIIDLVHSLPTSCVLIIQLISRAWNIIIAIAFLRVSRTGTLNDIPDNVLFLNVTAPCDVITLHSISSGWAILLVYHTSLD